jgi:hypothetical protein
MRRAERLMSLSASWDFLKNRDTLRLGLVDNNIPYIVPLNYVLVEDVVYIHSAKDGRKIDLIEVNNNVCIEVDETIGVKQATKGCKFSCFYRSVIATGEAFFIDDIEKKGKILNLLVSKYAKDEFVKVENDEGNNVHVIGIKITDIKGKELLP